MNEVYASLLRKVLTIAGTFAVTKAGLDAASGAPLVNHAVELILGILSVTVSTGWSVGHHATTVAVPRNDPVVAQAKVDEIVKANPVPQHR